MTIDYIVGFPHRRTFLLRQVHYASDQQPLSSVPGKCKYTHLTTL